MVTFIVVGDSDEAFHSAWKHDVKSFKDIKEMKCGSAQHGYRHYTRCTASDDEFEAVVLWYEETLNHSGNLPSGYITVIENHQDKYDEDHYMIDEYDEYGRRLE